MTSRAEVKEKAGREQGSGQGDRSRKELLHNLRMPTEGERVNDRPHPLTLLLIHLHLMAILTTTKEELLLPQNVSDNPKAHNLRNFIVPK